MNLLFLFFLSFLEAFASPLMAVKEDLRVYTGQISLQFAKLRTRAVKSYTADQRLWLMVC